ncbi:hypothetical protein [Streptococcus alactolyticus]|uniref:PTS transporter n=1 Tax=Streptococcus alactolyticus TaxID=29389 RepID=A0A6N7WPM8_STRAY|nr:hypothetical protein [Streptococcus alactolyticus]MST53880.1 hypothetical protein [Streptococcus alactolyticus]WBB07109.1 hypothetical protein O6R09_04090 [Streptococcus alactolyticus]
MAALTDKEKQKLDALRRENGIKNMYYTRYFLIRYVVAFFFFSNLYWILMFFSSANRSFIIVPSLLAVLGGICMWEQSRMYSKEQKPAVKTQFYFQTIIAVNAVLMIVTLFNRYQYFYPFLSQSTTTKVFLLILLSFGIGIASWMLVKINRINHNADKQYYRIQQYLASIS